ncbi:hypothetical protein NPIL_341961 [Nephila pilipes]|uniref:HTH CENPB-type domain-containing protein n=1 Tax=Nephila pilipes TaxID=299642 RepID=A0A8X6IHK7_NEPPI|nr:hypothetical protein NPIL_341961 [Nephila pilipes]
MDTFSASNGWISRFKIYHGDDDADEKWFRVAEDVPGVKFSDCISIDQDVATCGILSTEVMCDECENKNNGEEAEEDHANEDNPSPVPSLSDTITAFETFRTVRTFIYEHEITEKEPEKCCKS